MRPRGKPGGFCDKLTQAMIAKGWRWCEPCEIWHRRLDTDPEYCRHCADKGEADRSLIVAIRARAAGEAEDADEWLRYARVTGLRSLIRELESDAVAKIERHPHETDSIVVAAYTASGEVLASIQVDPRTVRWQVPRMRDGVTLAELEHDLEDHKAEAMFRNPNSPYHGLL